MIDQFSPEYIKFLASDEARVLQKHKLECWNFFM